MWAEIVARSCRSEVECVGAVFVSGDELTHLPLDNVHATPHEAFEVGAPQVLRLLERAERDPSSFLALYHSHVGRPATLSAEDQGLRALPCQFLVVLRVDEGRLSQLVWFPNRPELLGF